jgi:hypothetical protein
MIETDESKNDNIKIKFKVYPYVDINRKDNHVGDIKVVMNTDNLPFTYFDQVDHMMYNLFGYVRDRDKPEKYFINKTHEKVYKPPEYLGGKNRKTMKKSEKTRINKKSKKNKRKTYKR